MKLKNLLLITGACCCMTVMAQNATSEALQLNAKIEAKLRPATEKKAVNTIRNLQLQMAPQEIQKRATNTQLDSVINFNADGSKLTRQYFVYNDNGWWIGSYNSYWDATAGAWGDPVQEYTCTRMPDGSILSEQNLALSNGIRQDYKYDEKGRGIQQLNYMLENGEWVKTGKGEYTYDENDNIIEEYTYMWDGAQWVNSSHNYATWDAGKRQTSIESYAWDGTQWAPAIKADYSWFDGPIDPDYIEGTVKERMTYKGEYFWINNAWVLAYSFENGFNEDGRLIMQAEKYYNRTYRNWSGGDDFDGLFGRTLTWKSAIAYNERGLQNKSETYQCISGAEERYILMGYTTYEDENKENGDLVRLATTENLTFDENYEITGKLLIDMTWTAYNKNNKKLWVYEEIPNASGETIPVLEDKYAYDENGNMTESMVFNFENGKRITNQWTSYKYDAVGNAIEVTGHTSNSGGIAPIGVPAINPKNEPITQRDPYINDMDINDDWKYSNKWTYKYENGMQTERFGYSWVNETWTNLQGQVNTFDFTVKIDEMNVPEAYTDVYKIDKIAQYIPNGNDWIATEQLYYYSDPQGTGVTKAAIGSQISFIGNILRITGAHNHIDNRVYDITGKQVFQGNHSEENLHHLSKGIYIVKSRVDGETFVLKIFIE